MLREFGVRFVRRGGGAEERSFLGASTRRKRRLDLGVRDREDLLTVYAGNVVQERQGDPIDFLDRLRTVEDRAVLHLEHEQQRVRRAEHAAVLLIELDVRMPWRIQ